MNSGDTGFVMLSAALVMLMTPGLAFFYGGMVRKKNILGVLMQCFIAMCLLSVHWILIGYSLAFAPSPGFWGGFAWAGLRGIGMGAYPDYAATIPHRVFIMFQAMFAVITPALIVGAFAERMRFSAFLAFTLLWATFVYAPVCHWVWGIGGFLRNAGVLDFAGGIVVHTTAGFAALVTTLVIGRRKNLEKHIPSPHNLPFVVLGTGLLWFGWFGFNAGSALAADAIAANAFMTTNTAAAAAGLSWALLEWVRNGKPTMFGTATGCIAGLATITPGSGFVSPFSAVVIGVLASVVCFIFVSIIKVKFGYDDSLDAFGVHGIGGVLGTVLIGLFAETSVNAHGADGVFFGNYRLVLTQVWAVAVCAVYTIVVTFILYKLVDVFLKIRVSEQEEILGLDLSQHRERAYTVLE